MKNHRYDILFEPVKIGPVTARNRFYQVPHCNGLGHVRPKSEAAMRAMKAEGGWAVVSNQETEIHPSSDLSPFAENRIWDARDIPALRLMTDSIHEKGALATIELVHNGHHARNLFSRLPVLGVSEMSLDSGLPKQARAMDKQDIARLRQWHKDAAKRAMEAGFDIVYVYAGHNMAIPQHFMLPYLNQRTDEYGGCLENRVRLTKELLEDTREVLAGRCAVAFRFAVDEMAGEDGMQASEEGRAVVEMLSELPDLWDVNVSDWSNDSVTSRFVPEGGYQNEYIQFVKGVTSKPVVAVGRFTSVDLMASMVKKGIVDFIGAARPSIADPFMPLKIAEDRIEDIRECIGCNICVTADSLSVPIRCTQNPTMGEEWRRGWHPEEIAPKASDDPVLVIGAGPAGLECALQLAKRGYSVTLAEASGEVGGRVRQESRLPGLSTWQRVVDYRFYQLQKMSRLELFLHSPLDADQVSELGIPHVFCATGSHWQRNGVGRSTVRKHPNIQRDALIYTPDDLMGKEHSVSGRVVIYDDDQAYLAGVLAEKLALEGCEVTFVTPATVVSPFTEYTMEQHRIQEKLIHLGVKICVQHTLGFVDKTKAELICVYTGNVVQVACDSVVMVCERVRETSLYDALQQKGGYQTLALIGDAESPGLIADAVFLGHLAARNFERPIAEVEAELFRREMVSLRQDS